MNKILSVLFLIVSYNLVFAQSESQWNNYIMYREANRQVTRRPLAILMGDSITDNWDMMHPEFFTENNILGRGRCGETTFDMLVRFKKDVVDHHPKYVVILAGTNDAGRWRGRLLDYISYQDIVNNIICMCQLAKFNKIRPVICSITPRNTVEGIVGKIVTLNSMLQAYARENHIKFIDMHTPLKDEHDGLPEEYADDGVHPNLRCYKIMEQMLLNVIK